MLSYFQRKNALRGSCLVFLPTSGVVSLGHDASYYYIRGVSSLNPDETSRDRGG